TVGRLHAVYPRRRVLPQREQREIGDGKPIPSAQRRAERFVGQIGGRFTHPQRSFRSSDGKRNCASCQALPWGSSQKHPHRRQGITGGEKREDERIAAERQVSGAPGG